MPAVGSGPEFKGEKVPTLAEALDFLKGKARLNIEVKTSDTTEELWKTAVRGAVVEIDKRDMWEQVIFSSFSPEALWYVKELKPEAALGLLDWDLTRENNNKQKLLDMGGKYWLLHGSLLSEEVISEAHRQGLEVFSGVGDDPDGLEARLKAALDMGLDVIATDHAGEVWEALKRIL
ncbi:MAG: glycerophosphodiester phosphodiesterase [Limnochordia bacterium]